MAKIVDKLSPSFRFLVSLMADFNNVFRSPIVNSFNYNINIVNIIDIKIKNYEGDANKKLNFFKILNQGFLGILEGSSFPK
jgi:hypothetical protein